ncbi:hypothetical protein JOM56_011679 [Amanita muscaria]
MQTASVTLSISRMPRLAVCSLLTATDNQPTILIQVLTSVGTPLLRITTSSAYPTSPKTPAPRGIPQILAYQACRRSFSASGYTSHVHQTKKDACLIAHRQEIQQAHRLDHLNSFETSLGSANAPEQSAVHNNDDFMMHHPEHEEDHVQSGGEDLNDDIPEPRNLTPQPEPPLEIESFPSDFTGMPISQAAANVDDCDRSTDEFGPFKSLIDWEVAKWAKLRGPSSSALNELLAIDGLVERLGLSFKSVRDINTLIDTKLPGRPTFHHQRITVSGKTVSLYSRDIIECISTLYGDLKFVHHLINRPERQYKKEGDHRTRVFHDMHTGDWWWEMQRHNSSSPTII